MLALVLTLALAGPGVGLAVDLAYHAGGHHAAGEETALDAPSATTTIDPGLAAHVHCGCHLVARLEIDLPPPPPMPGRPLPAHLAQARPSVDPDRLPRPPRA